MLKQVILIIAAICVLRSFAVPQQNSQFDNNEFAEFEVSDDSTDAVHDESESVIHEPAATPAPVETKPEEDFFVTEDADDEFEGYEEKQSSEDSNTKLGGGSGSVGDERSGDIKPLTFADIPSHFRSNWSSYQVEAVALLIISLYIINYLYGKSQNSTIAYNWFQATRPTLEKHFALVGDSGTSQEPSGGILMTDTDYSYSCWCSGRQGCIAMLTHIKLNKRQDLLGLVMGLIRPKFDRVVHKIELEKGEMDSYVMLFGKRKSLLKEVKDLNDLGTYATERKIGDKLGLPDSFAVFAEISESVSAIIDSSTAQFLSRYEKAFEYIHISDQYSGAKPTEEAVSKLAETKPVLIFSYFLLDDCPSDEELVLFMFHLLERVRRYRLSKEGKSKADRKRQEVEESFIRATHQQRQEAAMARREEKTRERKQRVMDEEDPEKQKRLEKLEQKRDTKAKQARMKQFKIK